jgi:hypothetical protein
MLAVATAATNETEQAAGAAWARWDSQFRDFLTERMGALEFKRHRAIWFGHDEAVARLSDEIDALRPAYIWAFFSQQRIGPLDFGLPAHDDAVALDCDITLAWEAFMSDEEGTRAAWERLMQSERSRLESGWD